MKRIALIAVVMLAGGCGGDNQVYGLGVVPQNVGGDENKVSVFNVWSATGAKPLADRHCRQYGKEAVFSGMSAITAHFTCEKPLS